MSRFPARTLQQDSRSNYFTACSKLTWCKLTLEVASQSHCLERWRRRRAIPLGCVSVLLHEHDVATCQTDRTALSSLRLLVLHASNPTVPLPERAAHRLSPQSTTAPQPPAIEINSALQMPQSKAVRHGCSRSGTQKRNRPHAQLKDVYHCWMSGQHLGGHGSYPATDVPFVFLIASHRDDVSSVALGEPFSLSQISRCTALHATGHGVASSGGWGLY